MAFDRLRVLGWGIPITCLLVSGTCLVQKNQELAQVDKLRDQARLEVEQAVQQRKQVESLPTELKYATVPNSASEDYNFVTYLKGCAAKCGVHLTNWNVQPSEPQRDRTGKATPEDPHLKGIDRIETSLTVNGAYSSLREMVATLQTSDRLYSLSNLSWVRTPNGTSLTVTVTRYVATNKLTDHA